MEVEYRSNSDRVLAEIGDGTFLGLVHACEYALGEARAVVPLDEAVLERSGAVTQDRSIDTAAISFDTVYAVRQHEELTWRHAPGRKAKYLEDTVYDPGIQNTMMAIVATQARRAAGG